MPLLVPPALIDDTGEELVLAAADEPTAPAPPVTASHLCCKVVLSGNARGHHAVPLMPDSGRRLRLTDTVVTARRRINMRRDGALVVGSQPERIGVSAANRRGVLSALRGEPTALQTGALRWHTHGGGLQLRGHHGVR